MSPNIRLLLVWLIVVPLAALAKPPAAPNRSPQVQTKNGTLRGSYLAGFHEDLFLGVPFAAPPVGDLRLRHPAPYNEHWQHERDATQRSPSCPGYAGFDVGLTLGEDCLTVDVVRPHGISSQDRLPVFVWIYGGGKR
jgi:cholinesterase